MGTDRSVTLPQEGRLAAHPLAGLLGRLGLVCATGVLDVTHRKLVRRFVLDAGRVEAVVSNAREDRFADWLLGNGAIALDEGSMGALAAAVEGRPLTAFAVRGLLAPDVLAAHLRTHALALLVETAGFADATFAIRPGRVPLGDEPRAGLSAIEAALALARDETARARRPMPLPGGILSLVDPAALDALPCEPLEHDLLAACAEPVDPSSLGGKVAGASFAQLQPVLDTLRRAGLAATATVTMETGSPVDDDALTAEALDRWLAAAKIEDHAALLGVAPGADEGTVRRAYYQTVRRFHPDRFRSGPFASRHADVEQAFRIVHEALALLTDPKAMAEYRQRGRQQAQAQAHGGRDPAQLAALYFASARTHITAGRRADALADLERAAATFPGEPKYHLHLGMMLAANPARRREAVDRLVALNEQYAGRAEFVAVLAAAYARSGRGPEAQTALSRALSLDPAQPIARALSGDPAALATVKSDPFTALLF